MQVVQTIESLRAEAQAQHDRTQQMNFLAAMQYTEGGFNQFRLIYERPGALGEYLYPSTVIEKEEPYITNSHMLQMYCSVR